MHCREILFTPYCSPRAKKLPRSGQFLPHKRGLCRHAVCLCVSVTFVSCVKTNKDIFEIFSLPGSQAILVFPCQTGWRYSDGSPPNRGVEYRWGRQKTRFWTNIWLRCIQVYTVVNRTSREVWETKPRRTESSRVLTAASVVRCSHKTTTKCLWRARRYTSVSEVNPRTQLLGHNPVFCCRRTS